MPPVSVLTISLFDCIIWSRSSLTLPTETPIFLSDPDAALAKCSDAFNKALEGIQPTFKQVPPSVARLSIHATVMPSWAARMAPTYPPGPAPMTIKSKLVFCISFPF